MAATDQIRQMVNFILQEAHEKANEIRVKVCHRRPQCCDLSNPRQCKYKYLRHRHAFELRNRESNPLLETVHVNGHP
jgi:hypothetical protein